MDSAKHAVLLILHGVKDCFCGFLALRDFLCAQEPNVSVTASDRVRRSNHQGNARSKLLQCAVFSLFFWISNFIFDRIFLQYIFIQLAEWTGEDLDANRIVWLQRALYSTFCVLWILPLLVLSKLLNFIWYQDIADDVLVKLGVKKRSDIKISDFYADLIKSIIVQMCYCLQAVSAYFLPLPVFIQNLWYLFHFALLYSLYAFEYKWVHMGWPLHKRLQNIDRKWPYYLGFGLPLAVVTTFFSSFIGSMIIFSALFPYYVISSAVTYDSQSPTFSHPFHTFKIADFISDKVILSIPFFRR